MKKTASACGLFLYLFLLFSCNKENVPVVITADVTNILGMSATSGGNITDEGSGAVTERGICWSTLNLPTIADSKTDAGSGAGAFICNITNLEGSTKYYVRAYAKNSSGTGYGAAKSFTTLGSAPLIIAFPATNITTTTATLNGSVNANYLPTTVTFEYGFTEFYGQSVSFPGNIISGNLNTPVSAELTGLDPGMLYHFRIKAENSLGILYSEDIEFTTSGQIPIAITQAACCFTYNSAELHALINANYLPTIVTFEFGTSGYGTVYTDAQHPVTGNSPVSVNATVTGLDLGTTYHFRVMAENSLGKTYGSDMTFTTLSSLYDLTDIDGNIYSTCIAGGKRWMAENLKTTKFRDGTDIPGITGSSEWAGLNSAAFCWYDNNEGENKDKFGALYNWSSVNTGKLCPTGWHVPSNNEWLYVIYNLGGEDVAGGKLKEIETTHWLFPNAGATNEFNFTGLPGGERSSDGSFNSMGERGNWWASNPGASPDSAFVWSMFYDSASQKNSSSSINSGFSVRCVQDNQR